MFSRIKVHSTYLKASSILILIIGVLAFFGSSVYPDLFFQIKSKIMGEFINYSTLEEFCGWTGLPFPGESASERGIRAYWNMLSAMLGVTALSFVIFLSFTGIIIAIIKFTLGFNENDSS